MWNGFSTILNVDGQVRLRRVVTGESEREQSREDGTLMVADTVRYIFRRLEDTLSGTPHSEPTPPCLALLRTCAYIWSMDLSFAVSC